MKVGAEPKKVVMLAGLVLVGGYLFYSNVLSQSAGGPPPGARVESTPAVRTPVAAAPKVQAVSPARRPARARTSDDFRPTLKLPEGDDRPDPMSIDPTLRLDLLAKVQAVELQGGQRNLFQFSTAPPPPAATALKGPEPKVPVKNVAAIGKMEQKNAAAPGKAPVAPINLKYYGYSTVHGENAKKAFFLDGEDILVATEGEVLKKHYRVVRIGVSSVVMEDTLSKTQQTLPLQEEAMG